MVQFLNFCCIAFLVFDFCPFCSFSLRAFRHFDSQRLVRQFCDILLSIKDFRPSPLAAALAELMGHHAGFATAPNLLRAHHANCDYSLPCGCAIAQNIKGNDKESSL